MFGGNHKAWLYHTWNREKRELHHVELEARWWSGNVNEWWDKQKKIDVDYTGVRHRIAVSHWYRTSMSGTDPTQDRFRVWLVDIHLDRCPNFSAFDQLYFQAWAQLDVDIDTAAGVTVIV